MVSEMLFCFLALAFTPSQWLTLRSTSQNKRPLAELDQQLDVDSGRGLSRSIGCCVMYQDDMDISGRDFVISPPRLGGSANAAQRSLLLIPHSLISKQFRANSRTASCVASHASPLPRSPPKTRRALLDSCASEEADEGDFAGWIPTITTSARGCSHERAGLYSVSRRFCSTAEPSIDEPANPLPLLDSARRTPRESVCRLAFRFRSDLIPATSPREWARTTSPRGPIARLPNRGAHPDETRRPNQSVGVIEAGRGIELGIRTSIESGTAIVGRRGARQTMEARRGGASETTMEEEIAVRRGTAGAASRLGMITTIRMLLLPRASRAKRRLGANLLRRPLRMRTRREETSSPTVRHLSTTTRYRHLRLGSSSSGKKRRR